MATIYRGLSGSQYVFSEGSPPVGALFVTVYSEGGVPGGSDKGSFDTADDLPNTRSGSTDTTLSIGDYASVLSESLETYYCLTPTVGFASWSQLYGEPTDVTNSLEAWWESDRGITLDGSNGVISWADWTGKYVLTSSTSDRPNYNYFLLENGKCYRPTVTFSGSQRMAGGNILDLNDTSMTWFVVVSSNPTQTSRIVDKRGTGGPGTGTGGYQISNLNGQGNFDNTAVDDGTNQLLPPVGGEIWGDDTIQVLTVQMDRSTGRLRCFADGISVQTDVDAAMINWNITTSRDFCIGNTSNTNGQQYTGEIAALLCYRALVTGSRRNRVEAYLNAKYRDDASYSS